MGEKANITAKTHESTGKLPVTKTQKRVFPKIKSSPANQILHLQRTLGNQEVQRLLKSGTIQAKLKIGKPNDKYEQEADRVADKVMSMPEPKGSSVNSHSSSVQRKSTCPECPEKEQVQTKPIADQITPLVQRQTEPEEEEVQTKLQRQEEEEEEPVQAKPAPNQTPAVTSNIESSVNSLKGRGQPLSESTRDFFEPSFGADFSQVRVHTDSQAAETAKSINAKAFTTGRNVVFGTGQYSPGTSTGKRLLAHELTHVVQQGEAISRASSIRTFSHLQRLGANPGCSLNERKIIHQAIYNARGWLNKAISQLAARPLSQRVIRSLRRNFGPTYGVAVNADLILGRMRRAYREISTIPFSCAGAGDKNCATRPCGYANAGAGGHSAAICRLPTLQPASHWRYQAGCVLHESFHAAFSRFTVDEYSGWHGSSSSTPTYPGGGTDPLLNADSYTTLAMDLS